MVVWSGSVGSGWSCRRRGDSRGSADTILPKFLAERRPVDAEHLGGCRPVAATLLKDRAQQGRLNQLEEPLVERGLDGLRAARPALLSGPPGNPLLDFSNVRRRPQCRAGRGRGEMLNPD